VQSIQLVTVTINMSFTVHSSNNTENCLAICSVSQYSVHYYTTDTADCCTSCL